MRRNRLNRPISGNSSHFVFKMDEYQQEALHHKRHDIAQQITWNDKTVRELKKRQLLTKAILEEVELLKVGFPILLRYYDV